MLTYRLADSFPPELRHEWEPLTRIQDERERRRQLEAYLDRGLGACHLAKPEIATLVEENLLRFDGERYRLLAWVVMPNHVHLLVEQWESLGSLLKSWKSYTATQANKALGRSGALWQQDYWDRFVRDLPHFSKAQSYLEGNPVKAGLCSSAAAWSHSSANPKWQWSAADAETRLLRGHLVAGRWLDRSADGHGRKNECLSPEAKLVWDPFHCVVRNLETEAFSRT
jgi:REP element-mobilizing transposase RayT